MNCELDTGFGITIEEQNSNYYFEKYNVIERDIIMGIRIKDLKLNLSVIGYEYKIDRKMIDILCEDYRDRYVPIEVKRNSGDCKALEQIINYIDLLNGIYGVLIAKNFTKRVIFESKSYNVLLYQYIITPNKYADYDVILQKYMCNCD